jgi:hypothetical protein
MALTFGFAGAASASGASVTVGGSVPANSGMIMAVCWWFPIPGSFSIADNINGPYSAVKVWQFPTSTTQWGLFAVQANTTGTPVITPSSTDAGIVTYITYTGLAGVLTFPSSDQSQATGTGTVINSGSFNCSVNNEYALGVFTGETLATISTVTPGPPFNNPGIQPVVTSPSSHLSFYEVSKQDPSGLGSGTSVVLNGTLSSSDTWEASVFGFYDNTTPSAIIPPGAKQTFVNTEYIQY